MNQTISLIFVALSFTAGATSIYISTDGTGDGMTPGTPLSSFSDIQATIARVRQNGGDIHNVLFERGDTFSGGLGKWTTSNVRIASYGDFQKPRPIFRCQQFVLVSGNVGAFTLEDLDLRHTGAEAEGIRCLGYGQGLTFRNLRIQGFSNNVTVQGDGGRWRGVTIDDCVLLDATSTSGRAQGIYVEGADGITIRRCVVDRCGTTPSTQSHGAYIHALCTGLVVEDCVFSRCAATGLQARPGGIVRDNVFIRNPVSLTYGYVLGASDPTPGGVRGEVSRNVIVHGTDISPDLIRGIGMQVANCVDVTIDENLIAYSASAQPWEAAMQFYMVGNGVGIEKAVVRRNQVIDWNAVLFLTTRPMPDHFVFVNNMVHRVRYPSIHPLLFFRTYQDDAWRKARVSDNTLIESATGKTYPGDGRFDDWDGLRAGQYDAEWLAAYFRDAWDFDVEDPEPPTPEPEPEPFVVEIPADVDEFVVRIQR